jgi:hypothetical protein
MVSDKDFLSLFRRAIVLLMKASHALGVSGVSPSSPCGRSAQELRAEIQTYLTEIKALKAGLATETKTTPERNEACEHPEPVRQRRISGNGWRFLWHCWECGSYMKPSWQKTDPHGTPEPPTENPESSCPECKGDEFAKMAEK